MSKSLTNQNLRLLEAIHSEIQFFKNFRADHLAELVDKTNILIFSSGSVLAQEKQQIDYLGIIIEGKVIISGQSNKKGAGCIFGHLAMFNLVNKHAQSIIGDSDGIILAIRFTQIPKLKEQMRNIITEACLRQCFITLQNRNNQQTQWIEQEQRKMLNMYPSHLKTFFNDQVDEKQRKLWLKFFPWKTVSSKDLVITKSTEPYILFLLRGELAVKKQSGIQTLTSGKFYNIEGFLTNFTTNANIFCVSEQATIMIINRSSFMKIVKSATFYKFSSYLLRQQVNQKNYEIQTYQKRKEKETQLTSNKWSIFHKSNQFQILPLNIPKHVIKQTEGKSKLRIGGKDDQKKQFMGTFFREQALIGQSKNHKTNSTNSSKFTKMVSLKTEKNQSIDQKTSTQAQLRALQKQSEQLQTKLQFYQENYVNLKLEMIEYQSKHRMNAVFKQINEMKDKKGYHGKNLGAEKQGKDSDSYVGSVMTGTGNNTTLKNAFEQQLRENRIMEVVARCAYKWLWAVRRKKQKILSENQQKIKN